jgi:hypothetical protein
VPTYFPGQPQQPRQQPPVPLAGGTRFPGASDTAQAPAAGDVPDASGLPELWRANLEGQGLLPGLQFLGAQAFNSDPEDMAKALEGVPGVSIARDKGGQPVATVGGKPYALNRQGVSPQDFGPMLASGIPLTALTGGVAGAAGVGTTLAGQGLAGAATGALETAGKQLSGVLPVFLASLARGLSAAGWGPLALASSTTRALSRRPARRRWPTPRSTPPRSRRTRSRP